jgi:dihydroxyacetone kinase-like protein
MPLDPALLRSMIAAAAERLIANASPLTELDQAIGDGDHGINMKRGCAQVLADLDSIVEKPTGEALKAVGMALVMKVGGASGPLYGSLFMGMGKALGDRQPTMAILPEMFAAGVEAVAARGKSAVGEKTMLDVLGPVLGAMRAGGPDLGVRLREAAARGAAATIPMRATKGRASFLGERSVGHMDPGARSSEIIVEAVSPFLDEHA